MLEAQKVIEDRMSDLEAACDSMEAAQQVRAPSSIPAMWGHRVADVTPHPSPPVP